MRSLGGVAGAAVLVCLAPVARASATLTDVDVRRPTIEVNRAGVALVQYVRSSGASRRVLVWGAVNGLAPAPGARQVRFRFDYAGGYGAFHDARYWRRFPNACRPYDGPRLAFFVAGCTAPDGSLWALQAWRRLQQAVELHVSHWTGPLALLDIHSHWTYGGQYLGLFGRVTYAGAPVHGYASNPVGNPRDRFGRNVYIDTFDSSSGPGWRRETGILLHSPTGTFCHSFIRPAAAAGKRFRVVLIGPGVTPDVEWEGPAPRSDEPSAAAAVRRVFDALMAGDARCAPER